MLHFYRSYQWLIIIQRLTLIQYFFLRVSHCITQSRTLTTIMKVGGGRNVVMKCLNMQLLYGFLYISWTTPELPIAHRWDCFWLNYCQFGSTDEFCVICRDVVIILTPPRVDLACSSLGYVVTLSVWMKSSIHLVVKGRKLQDLMNLTVYVHSFIGGHLNHIFSFENCCSWELNLS